MNASLIIRATAVLIMMSVGLTGCGGDMNDLNTYIDEVKRRKGGRIDPLPEITPYEVFTYVADAQSMRSPFVPDTPQATGNSVGGTRPDATRSREFLEGFPLDTLRMVGTLDISETAYALIQSSDGLIHRVISGNYMGQNDGRITGISQSKVELVEIISDGIGEIGRAHV
jgi:type IV pilus assembly protein PilP